MQSEVSMVAFEKQTSLDYYRASLSHVSTLDAEVEREMARRWAKGDERAGLVLIESSLPFVIKVAREYRRWGIPLEDLIQQGNLGLLKAAGKYDPGRECRLITYAAYWIRAEIRDYVMRGYRIVRLGSTRTERRAIRAYRREGVDTPEQLAEESGMPLARAKLLWPVLTQGDMSLDVSYDGRSSGVSRVEGNEESPEDIVAHQESISCVHVALEKALQGLSDRERRIVKARMMADETTTLEALGREMGVSKERVRQLEARAKKKLQVKLAEFRPAA